MQGGFPSHPEAPRRPKRPAWARHVAYTVAVPPGFEPADAGELPDELAEGARLIIKRGVRLARFRRRGRTIEAPLTTDGAKCRIQTAT